MLFVPGEAFLAPALERDPGLLEHAWSKNVHIVTPTSLISALRAVAYAWQQDALAANARDVFELGRELYKRLGTMGGHVDKLGRSLTRAVGDYNSTVGSLESQVLVTARKLNDLRVVDLELAEPAGLETAVRPLTKPELVASADTARVLTLADGSASGARPRLLDAALPDAELPDAQLPDAELADAELPDAQLPDAELPDAAAESPGADAELPGADADYGLPREPADSASRRLTGS
jgi:hypothetical protein